jgi:hypothetical protein
MQASPCASDSRVIRHPFDASRRQSRLSGSFKTETISSAAAIRLPPMLVQGHAR